MRGRKDRKGLGWVGEGRGRMKEDCGQVHVVR